MDKDMEDKNFREEVIVDEVKKQLKKRLEAYNTI
jgi:hypothetical protein